ncbi:MAG: zf-HC2 domain-containing protein [Planctomycetota bacterium]|jgi:predicted anti-sigma-YlaC factor YlaD
MQKGCEKITEMLVDYADGVLSAGESADVAEHLAKCANCRKMLNALHRSLGLADIIWADGLTELKAVRPEVPQTARQYHWVRYAAVAAAILIIAASLVIWRSPVRPVEPAPTFAEIERSISQSVSAARLLAATDLLTGSDETESIVRQQYSYIIETYPETAAAAKAKLRIK